MSVFGVPILSKLMSRIVVAIYLDGHANQRILGIPLPTQANTIALSFSGGSQGLAPANQYSTWGWAFTLSSPVLLTDLGFWDSSGTGLNESHLVTVWTSTGTQEAQTTVPSGTSAPIINGFRYESITPIVLPAGSYTIGALFAPGTNEKFAFNASTITTAPGVSYGGSRSGFGNAFPPGDIVNGQPIPNSYFGPNFQFTAAPTNGVPDPSSTWTLLLLGVTATFGLKFFVRRSA